MNDSLYKYSYDYIIKMSSTSGTHKKTNQMAVETCDKIDHAVHQIIDNVKTHFEIKVADKWLFIYLYPNLYNKVEKNHLLSLQNKID